MAGDKVTIVTISFNQRDYLERCINSVISQSYGNIEYIVVDGGSTDGSLDVLEQYKKHFARLIVGKDDGPADGLNRGFEVATGSVLGFLNSDDELLPFAITDLVSILERKPSIDVVSGHCLLVDGVGRLKRRLYSDRFTPQRSARRAAYLMQPSTLFRRRAFDRVGGFNIGNRSNWDGELWIDMGLHGCQFAVLNEFVSLYRVHGESITGSASMTNRIELHSKVMFKKVYGRSESLRDWPLNVIARLNRHRENPRGLFERIFYGSIYGSG